MPDLEEQIPLQPTVRTLTGDIAADKVDVRIAEFFAKAVDELLTLCNIDVANHDRRPGSGPSRCKPGPEPANAAGDQDVPALDP